MIVVDAHQDIAYNAFQYGRDFTASAWEKRRREAGTAVVAETGLASMGLPEAILGRVGVIFATLFVEPENMPMSSSGEKRCGYNTPRQAYEQALRQWDYYQRLADSDERIHLINAQKDLDAVLATWEPGCDLRDHRVGLVLLIEGADPILEPRQFEEWYERGVRIVGPAWSETRYAGGTGRPGPLTTLGRELLDVLADYGAVLDLSHMTEEGCLEALDRYDGPVIASHSNPTKFWDHHRNLTDMQIRRLAERGGVMGVVLYNRFMDGAWRKDDPGSRVPFERIVEIIDYVCQLTGSAAHIGIGTDADGGFGAESMPVGIDTVADLWTIGDALARRGYAPEHVTDILSGNFLRILRQALP